MSSWEGYCGVMLANVQSGAKLSKLSRYQFWVKRRHLACRSAQRSQVLCGAADLWSAAFLLIKVDKYVKMFPDMRILTFQFVGTTPLLLHHIDKHQFRSQLASKSELGKSFDDEAYEVMVKDSDGNPAVPVSWFRDAIKVGCSKILVEGKQVSFLKVSSAMRIKPDDFLPLKRVDGQAPEWQVYKSVQHAAPGSNTMIVVVAPEFREWKFEVEISCYLEFPPSDLLVRLLTEAGKSGIGLFHPPKKQFGQFRISS